MLLSPPQAPTNDRAFPRRALAGVSAVATFAILFWWSGRVPEDPTLGRSLTGDVLRITSTSGIDAHPTLSPDGRFIAYRSDMSGNGEILLRSLDGNDTTNLTDSPDDDSDPAFSPDGRRLAFRSTRLGGGIYIMHRDGTRLRRLTQFGASPSWTPDGRHLVFASRSVDDPMVRSGTSEGWKVEVATGLTTRLTQGDFVQPAVSPSGRRVAYSAYGTPNAPRRTFAPRSDIWTMSTDGHHAVPATSDAAMDWNPMWSADGRHLYFISNRSGMTALWGLRIDERTGRALGDPVAIPSPPASPAHLTRTADGRRLAWSTLASRRALHQVLYDADTRSTVGEPVPVLESTWGWHCAEHAPAGLAVAFRSLDPREGIHIIEAEGESVRKVSGDVVSEGCPRWSPDGRRLVFHGHRGDVNALWVADAQGEDVRLATRTIGALTFPAWAPDSTRAAAYDAFQGRVRIFRLTGDEPATDSVDALPVFSQGTFLPASWSPDGTALAGTASGAVWVYSFGAGTFERLTEGAAPAWLNTSRRLLAASSGRIVLVDVPTRFTREILARPQQVFGSPVLSPDNGTLYVTRERAEADIWVLTLR